MGKIRRSSFLPQPFQELGDVFKWPFPRFLESWGNEVIPQTPINISDTKNGYQIKAEVPGVKKEDISIDIDNYELTLKIEKKENIIEDQEEFYRREIRTGLFQRTFELPPNANPESIEAELENGVLKILIPKKESPQKETKKIEIK